MDDAPTIDARGLLEHSGWIRNLARKLVDDEQRADDLVQQAWLAALEKPPTSGAPIRAWLARVVRNVAWKERRSATRREERERIAAAADARAEDPASVVAEIAAQRLVADALLALSEPYRETLVRRWYRDEKPAAIARAMDVPVKTVETRLARGLESLRAELTRLRGGDRRAWALLLVPMAARAELGAAAATGLVLGNLAAGVAAMSATMKLAAVAIVAAAAGAAWWWIGASIRGGARTIDVASAQREAASAATSTTPGTPADRSLETLRSPASRDDAHLALRVLRSDGTPVEAGRIVLFAGDEVLGAASIRDGSTARPLPTPDRDASAIVHVLETLPIVVPIAAGTREQIVKLPRESVLAGRLHVAGAPPPRRLQFTFHAAGHPDALVGTPQAAWIALHPDQHGSGRTPFGTRRVGLPTVRAIVWTDDTGRFRFEGLSSGQPGRLLAPHGYAFSPVAMQRQGQRTALQEIETVVGTESLELELHPIPAVTGRLVDRDEVPVRDARVNLRGQSESGAFASSDVTDAEGRFRIALWNGAPTSASVEAFHAPSGGHASVQLEPPLGEAVDLGDLKLTAARTVELDVLDADGIRIARYAVAAQASDGWHRLQRAGAPRDAWLVPAESRQLRITARGFDPKVIELSETEEPRPREVRLERATDLVVRLQAPDGGGIEGCMVQLVGRPDLFRTTWLDAGRTTASDAGFDDTTATNHWRDGSERADQFTGAAGVARFSGLLAEVPIDVRVNGGMQDTVFETVVHCRSGEVTELVVPLPAPRSWKGRVVDAAGRPVLGASIGLQRLDLEHHGSLLGPLISTPTGSDGRFELDRLLEVTAPAHGYFLSVIAAGYGMERKRLALPAEGEVTTIVLRPEWPLAVDVRDDRGLPVRHAEITATLVAESGVAQGVGQHGPFAATLESREDDDYRFALLPRDPIEVRVEVGGRVFTRRVDPPASSVRIDVPSTSSVVVRYSLPLPDEQTRGRYLDGVVLEPLEDAGQRVRADATRYDPPRRDGDVAFAAVFPGRYRILLAWGDEDGNELELEEIGGPLEVRSADAIHLTIGR